MKTHLTFLMLMVVLLFSCCRKQELTVQDLQCEYLSNPLAIGSDHPLLSWKLVSAKRSKTQSAYRILVAGNPSLLQDGKADYWDSGKVPSGKTVQIKYNGKQLSSRSQLFWKIMVWDEEDQPSSWSDAATWSMGLLNPSDWTARWIGLMEDPYPDSTLTHPAPYFRKEINVSKPIKRAVAYVCGLGFYEMYMNGEKVGDQVLAPAVSNFDKRTIKKYYINTMISLLNVFFTTHLMLQTS